MNGEFVDTNIIVYSHDLSSGAKNVCARELMERLWATSTGVVSIQVLQELYVVVTRKVRSADVPRRAIEIIEDLEAWLVHEPRAADIAAAARLSIKHQISFWDAMIIRSAIETGARI